MDYTKVKERIRKDYGYHLEYRTRWYVTLETDSFLVR